MHPRIRSVSGGEQPRFNPLASVPDVFVMKICPEVLFRHPGPQFAAHAVDAFLARSQRLIHQDQLAGRFDGASNLHHCLSVKQREAAFYQIGSADRVQPVDCEAKLTRCTA